MLFSFCNFFQVLIHLLNCKLESLYLCILLDWKAIMIFLHPTRKVGVAADLMCEHMLFHGWTKFLLRRIDRHVWSTPLSFFNFFRVTTCCFLEMSTWREYMWIPVESKRALLCASSKCKCTLWIINFTTSASRINVKLKANKIITYI